VALSFSETEKRQLSAPPETLCREFSIRNKCFSLIKSVHIVLIFFSLFMRY